jgi:hypothetical protein
MLRLLERDAHGQRLCELLSRYRVQELELTALLHDLQTAAEMAHFETSRGRLDGESTCGATLARCSDLQMECDLVATELVHVRMAVAGACEELADHDERRFRGQLALTTSA